MLIKKIRKELISYNSINVIINLINNIKLKFFIRDKQIFNW